MNVDSGAPHFAYLHGRTVLRILFPRISKKATHLLHTVILTDTHRATPPLYPRYVLPHRLYGHARPPHPRRIAVLVHAGGCWFPGCFWRWPVAVYARSRVTAAHSSGVHGGNSTAPCALGQTLRKWICAHVLGVAVRVALAWTRTACLHAACALRPRLQLQCRGRRLPPRPWATKRYTARIC